MNNWEAVHECQDEQDAERLQKWAQMTAESLAMTQSLARQLAELDPMMSMSNPFIKQMQKSTLKLVKQCSYWNNLNG